MEDVRKLVPREPPEGFLAWAAETMADELETFGMLYEQEWVEDWGLEAILDEWAAPRKRRMVRVECSCCGYRDLYHYGRMYGNNGYGFVLPESYAEVEGGTVYGDGDNILCPNCGAQVLIRKRADLRSRGYAVTSGANAMSAAVVGEERYLVLTCWVLQRQTSYGGGARLEAIPAEAYVFSPADCAQLMGWRNGYSGTGGYFVEYTRSWRQPKNWKERWHREEHIYGLTPELVSAVDEALEKRELIKINVLKNCDDDRNQLAEVLAERTHSQVVQVVGRKIVLFRFQKDSKKRKIELSE